MEKLERKIVHNFKPEKFASRKMMRKNCKIVHTKLLHEQLKRDIQKTSKKTSKTRLEEGQKTSEIWPKQGSWTSLSGGPSGKNKCLSLLLVLVSVFGPPARSLVHCRQSAAAPKQHHLLLSSVSGLCFEFWPFFPARTPPRESPLEARLEIGAPEACLPFGGPSGVTGAAGAGGGRLCLSFGSVCFFLSGAPLEPVWRAIRRPIGGPHSWPAWADCVLHSWPSIWPRGAR